MTIKQTFGQSRTTDPGRLHTTRRTLPIPILAGSVRSDRPPSLAFWAARMEGGEWEGAALRSAQPTVGRSVIDGNWPPPPPSSSSVGRCTKNDAPKEEEEGGGFVYLLT